MQSDCLSGKLLKGRFHRGVRLTTAAEYSHVFERPIRCSNHLFTVLVRDNGLSHPRVGLAVSAKHFRRAVARNQIKRQVRESFRLHQEMLPKVDIVVLSKKGGRAKSSSDYRSAIDQLWQRVWEQCAGS